jgi:hypothetical protein
VLELERNREKMGAYYVHTLYVLQGELISDRLLHETLFIRSGEGSRESKCETERGIRKGRGRGRQQKK